jgi:small subunit ribosomal protein S8
MTTNTIKFLVNLKNYSILKKEIYKSPYSKQILQIVKCLYKEGFIQSFYIEHINSKYFINILLRFFFNKPVFKNLKIISKPSNTKIVPFKHLARISNKKFVLFISTNQGVLTLEDCKKRGLGGSVLFYC